jgi:hypothetical protein
MYEGYKIYGPYDRKDGRLHVVMVHSITKQRKTVSYPKYLMEVHLNRYLAPDETIDHIDNDPLNNNISNLRILTRVDHCRSEAHHIKGQDFICPQCGETFHLSGTQVGRRKMEQKRKPNRAGPFCSKSCAGKYSTDVQNNRVEPVQQKLIEVEYYRPKDQE